MDKMENAMSDEYEKHRQYEIKMEKQIMELRELVKVAREALKLLHDNTAEYIILNHLGNEYQNHDMRLAKIALAKIDASEVMKP